MLRRLAGQLIWFMPCAFPIWAIASTPVTMLVGETVVCDGSQTEGHPIAYEWYVTEPDGSPPGVPTSTEISFPLTLDTSGDWSIELIARYLHQAPAGGLYDSTDTVELRAKTVVASISLSSTQITVEESLTLDGSGSRWSPGVAPTATWKLDGVPFSPCNAGPPPAVPADLDCVVPPGTLDPGPHSASLQLWDSGTGNIDQDSANFDVIDVIPFSVDFSWQPFNPNPGQTVQFDVVVQPPEMEPALPSVTWTWGDGSPPEVVDCQTPWGCTIWSHVFTTQGWYDVNLTAMTSDDSAEAGHSVEVGNPPDPPSASFTATPPDPLLLQSVSFTFTGSCPAPCSYLWTFGDGGSATVQNPSYAYAIPNSYTVQLTVSNDGGMDSDTEQLSVTECWSPPDPIQNGNCYGAAIQLIAGNGTAYLWSTGVTTPSATVSQPGAYWVDVEQGSGCWGHAPWTVSLANCGDSGGDANLDGATDSADFCDLARELTDGDGDSVVSAGGGELTAPGGDVNLDGLLNASDVLGILAVLYAPV